MSQVQAQERGVLNLQVSSELLDQLRRLAAMEDRSLAGTVRHALREYVESK